MLPVAHFSLFLSLNPKIRHAFIGGSAITAAAIQAWVLYGVLLSENDPKSAVVLFQIYLFSSLGPLFFQLFGHLLAHVGFTLNKVVR
ncbi:hypothetical protein [Mannheimia haemolytica]|uniref:hypothetical protein n=1 Tax=Mannheimia haemolytica TaxID=75985 RepID=UPI001EFEF9FB|nr:hypothetical protein [Mannheimia haemolytica]